MSFWTQVVIQSCMAGLVVGTVSYITSKKGPEQQRRAVIMTLMLILVLSPFFRPKWSDNQTEKKPDQNSVKTNPDH